MIPRIIHYCWLSDDPVPEDCRRYINGWHEKLPDWEFMLWDRKRFDVQSVLWTKQAFEAELYAFAADYIRLYAVYHHGGIYLDMDMEVIKSFEPLLEGELLLALENHLGPNLEAGCFGARPAHPYILQCMRYIESRQLFDPRLTAKVMGLSKPARLEFIDPPILPFIMRTVLNDYTRIDVCGGGGRYHLYSPDFFTAKNVETGVIEKTDNTYTIHHFQSRYHSEKWCKVRDLKQRLHDTFAGHSVFIKLVSLQLSMMSRIDEQGVGGMLKYYFGKYLFRFGRKGTCGLLKTGVPTKA